MAMLHCEPGEMYLVNSEAGIQFTFRNALERLIELSTLEVLTYSIDEEFVRPTNVPRLIADT